MITIHHFKNYSLLFFTFVIYSMIAVCAKKAASFPYLSNDFFVYFAVELSLLGLYAFLWQQVLKHFDLVVAVSNKSMVVILNLCWAFFLFQEKITIYNVAGAIIIIFGMLMVTSDA